MNRSGSTLKIEGTALMKLGEARDYLARLEERPNRALATSLVAAAQAALQQATSPLEVKDIRDKVKALETYFKQQRADLVASNLMVAQRLRTERRLGEMLAEMDKNVGGNPNLLHDETGCPPTLPELGITRPQSHRWQRIAQIDEQDFELWVSEYLEELEFSTAALLRLWADVKGVHFSSETDEWLTPSRIIQCVLRMWGEIDLDPCSNSHEEPNVPAKRHFTIEDDGLAHDWYGRVYMNPPYGYKIAEWVEHLCEQFRAGNVTEAIALVPSRTDTEWFKLLREWPRCFIWGRLRFSGGETGAPFPSMVVYLGRELTDFTEAFEDIGDIYFWAGARIP